MSKKPATPARKHPNKPHKASEASPKGRVSRKVRDAIKLMATAGKSQKEASEIVGMNRAALCRALKREPAKALLIQEKTTYLAEVDELHAYFKKRAILVAAELMEQANSESVKMRAVEFFAGQSGESKQAATVNLNVNTGGYGYLAPGAQIVDITPGDQDDDSSQGKPAH